jgi:hypothetical protein
MTHHDPQLFPHFNGRPNLAARGDFALAYKHPDDLHILHITPIFSEVSQEFIWEYVKSREWVRSAQESGWKFVCLPASDVRSAGLVQ